MMDILTEKGQASLVQERLAIDRFTDLFPKYQWLETAKQQPAAVDGFFYIHEQAQGRSVMSAVVEVKCRNETREHFRTAYDDEWLITHDKLIKGQRISQLCRVPLVGLLWLVPEQYLLVVKFTKANGDFLFDFEVHETETQATVNGGTAIRDNAFIPLSHAKEFPPETINPKPMDKNNDPTQ
tara:strand:+ start:351 stop:896 length:546 start_codon:yes stop_codon:yes gene_type:complete